MDFNEHDSDRKMQFCEELRQRLIKKSGLLYNICFYDKCTFYLNGAVNRHNYRQRDNSDTYLFQFISFTENNVSCGMLDDVIDPLITEIFEVDQSHNVDRLPFQKDEAFGLCCCCKRRFK